MDEFIQTKIYNSVYDDFAIAPSYSIVGNALQSRILCFVFYRYYIIILKDPRSGFIHIRQGCMSCTCAIVLLVRCKWWVLRNIGGISRYLTKTKHKHMLNHVYISWDVLYTFKY